jgi:hypothetical protein
MQDRVPLASPVLFIRRISVAIRSNHTLWPSRCDFRSLHVEFLGKLLVDSVSALIHQGVVPLETVAQDGMRVRASAGKCSVFGSRRRES